MAVAVVTDSTASLPADTTAAAGIRVVPLQVHIGDRDGREGVDLDLAELAVALADRRTEVRTSRPTPAEFAACYAAAFAAGADAVVSVHLSQELSGTGEAARLAAAGIDGDRVRVVDSRAVGMGLGFAVLAAAAAARGGAGAGQVAATAAAVAARVRMIFSVDSLDRLRRGGRIGAAAALVGTALAVKPLLHVVDGRIVLQEKVRTTARATQRLVELAVAAAGRDQVALAVHHLGAPGRAESLADRLQERLPHVGRPMIAELSAVLGAHTGTGVLGVVVAPGEPAVHPG